MKKIILGIIIGVGFTALVGAGIENYVVNNNTAEVLKLQNVYIFTDSKPIKEYEYLGTVKVSLVNFSSGQYTSVRDMLLKKAKKEYPQCQGIILTLKDGDIDEADVIKFK